MEAWTEKLRVFNARLSLSDDAAAKKYLGLINKQLAAADMTLTSLYDGCERTHPPATSKPLSLKPRPCTK